MSWRREASGTPTSLVVLATLAALGAVAVARPLLVPTVFAVLVAVALAPIVRGLRRVWVPVPLGAFLVLGTLVLAFGYGVVRLAEPAQSWIRGAPRSLDRIERKLRALKEPLEAVTEATQRMEDVAQVAADTPATTVTVREAGLGTLLATQLQGVTVGGLTTLFLAYFLLATDNRFFRRMIESIPGVDGSAGADLVSRALESQLSRYLITVTTVNALLGCAVAVATHALGLPNPALWGVMAMVLNYVPYIGGLVSTAILTAVALLTFDDPWDALVVPMVFVGLNSIEGMVITPIVLGRRMLLSPVAILFGVMLWSWLWGVAGALLAVPLLVTTSVIAEHVAPLRRLGILLRGE